MSPLLTYLIYRHLTAQIEALCGSPRRGSDADLGLEPPYYPCPVMTLSLRTTWPPSWRPSCCGGGLQTPGVVVSLLVSRVSGFRSEADPVRDVAIGACDMRHSYCSLLCIYRLGDIHKFLNSCASQCSQLGDEFTRAEVERGKEHPVLGFGDVLASEEGRS